MRGEPGVLRQRSVFLRCVAFATCSRRTNWKMLVKYFDAFWYPSSDDLTVVDETFTWALLFHHEELLFWGGNKPRAA